jgi:SPP1 gp7 family putative phage head morphogenesis protein
MLVADLAPRLDAAGGGVRFKLYETVKKKAIPAAETQGKRVGRMVDEDSRRVLGIDPRLMPSVGPQLDSFAIENVRLITKMTEEQHQAILKVINENFGLRHEELSEKLEAAFGVSQARADLIARDQTLKLAGDLTHIRQTQAGITSYVWTTSLDERVREEHAALEGEVFRWDSPPSVGHPGTDYCCRCTAYPLVPGFEDEG